MSFNQRFNDQYPEFIERLLGKSSDLTHREILLCMYLKLNYSNKELVKNGNL